MIISLPRLALILFTLYFSACSHFQPGIGKAVEFEKLPGWQQDQHAQALVAFSKGCTRMDKKAEWKPICEAVEKIPQEDDTAARDFFEQYFTAHVLKGERGKREGLITGYYEPLLHGSKQPDQRYRYPLYRSPDDMLIIDIASIYPQLEGKRVRGRLVGNKVIPYYSRAEIDSETRPLEGHELLWVDDRDQLFFLQIQGSGRIKLPDGSVIGAGYANQNGHAYHSIGRKLIDRGELRREDVSMFTIKDWLRDNPGKAEALLNENPSYVFFVLRDQVEDGPTGSLNVPLTAERSLAIDPKFITLGNPVWINTSYPGEEAQPLQKLVMAQDTGGAIKGQLRADLFWGTGTRAERMAGTMKQAGELYILLPKQSK